MSLSVSYNGIQKLFLKDLILIFLSIIFIFYIQSLEALFQMVLIFFLFMCLFVFTEKGKFLLFDHLLVLDPSFFSWLSVEILASTVQFSKPGNLFHMSETWGS